MISAIIPPIHRALAKTRVFAARVTGIVDATGLETTAQCEGYGQVTRTRKITDKRRNVHASEVTVSGWKLIILIDARTKISLAGKVVPINEHEVLSMRAPAAPAPGADQGHGYHLCRGLLRHLPYD